MPLVHRHAHDYLRLIRRWRKIARSSGLNLRAFCESSGYEIFVLEAARPVRGGASIYFSAGIHGDEAAASEALVTWAEENPSLLKKIQPMIFPCLNPWGLNNNCRFDSDGRDLNRCFHNNDVPQIAAQMRVLHDARFDLAILLHEDFDAQGYYIYELAGRRPYLGEEMIRAASRFIPVDMRSSIEGRRARSGIIRRRITPDLMPEWPEAFILHFHHAERTFTVETPSEFHLDARVAAHVAVIDFAVKNTLSSWETSRLARITD